MGPYKFKSFLFFVTPSLKVSTQFRRRILFSNYGFLRNLN